MRGGFYDGAKFGAALGMFHSIYARKLRYIPTYAIGFGLSYAAFHGASAYFRNEV